MALEESLGTPATWGRVAVPHALARLGGFRIRLDLLDLRFQKRHLLGKIFQTQTRLRESHRVVQTNQKQKQLAQKINVTVAVINEIETGKAKHNPQVIQKLKRLLK